MHLFLIDLFISIDTLGPFIYLQNKKSIICNVNPLQDHSKNNLIKFLVNNGSAYKKFIALKKNKAVIFFFLKILTKLPCLFQRKLYKFYFYIYNKTCFLSEENVIEFLIENKIKSITYEDSAPKLYISKIAESAKKLKIPLIKVYSGQIPYVNKNKTNDYLNTDFCNFIFVANNYLKFKKNFSKKKIRYYNTLRYSRFWLSLIKNTFYLERIKKSKMIIGFFLKLQSKNSNKVQSLLSKIKSDGRYIVFSREKPRNFLPLGCNKHDNDNLSSSQLIDLSDFIITARSSSILLEAIHKKKRIILLKYLNHELINSPYYRLRSIHKVSSEKEVFKIINNRKKLNSSNINEYNNFLKKYLKNYKKDSSLISQTKKFYLSF